MKNLIRTLLCCVLSNSPWVAAAAAQDKPDFSGIWVLQDPAQVEAEIPQTLVIRQPLTRINVFGEPMPPAFIHLTVERYFESGVRTEVYQIGPVGGIVGRIDGSGQPTTRSRVAVRWQRDHLHIETGLYSGTTRGSGPVSEHHEVWRMDGQGRLLMTVVDRGPDFETTRTLTYRPR